MYGLGFEAVVFWKNPCEEEEIALEQVVVTEGEVMIADTETDPVAIGVADPGAAVEHVVEPSVELELTKETISVVVGSTSEVGCELSAVMV